jgi:hypothetical protein
MFFTMSQCSEVATRQGMEYFITDIRTTKVERIVKPKAFVGLGDVNHQNRREVITVLPQVQS